MKDLEADISSPTLQSGLVSSPELGRDLKSALPDPQPSWVWNLPARSSVDRFQSDQIVGQMICAPSGAHAKVAHMDRSGQAALVVLAGGQEWSNLRLPLRRDWGVPQSRWVNVQEQVVRALSTRDTQVYHTWTLRVSEVGRLRVPLGDYSNKTSALHISSSFQWHTWLYLQVGLRMMSRIIRQRNIQKAQMFSPETGVAEFSRLMVNFRKIRIRKP